MASAMTNQDRWACAHIKSHHQYFNQSQSPRNQVLHLHKGNHNRNQ